MFEKSRYKEWKNESGSNPTRFDGLNSRHNQLQNVVLYTEEQLFQKCQGLFSPNFHDIMPLSVC